LIGTTCSNANTADQNLNIIIRGPTKEGVVQSPNFPNPFPANIHCKWNLIAPEGHNVKVFMETININVKNTCSLSDHYLNINDALQENTRPLRQITCGYSSFSRLKPSFYEFSSGKYLQIDFKSGSDTTTGYGFSANYTYQSLGEYFHMF